MRSIQPDVIEFKTRPDAAPSWAGRTDPPKLPHGSGDGPALRLPSALIEEGFRSAPSRRRGARRAYSRYLAGPISQDTGCFGQRSPSSARPAAGWR